MRQLGDLIKELEGKPKSTGERSLLAALDEPVAITPKQEPPTIVLPSAKAPHRGYLARELVQCTLPHRDPKKDVYIRKDGSYRLMIESGTDIRTGEKIGLPYGTLPRLLMLFVNTEAVRRQGKDDELIISFGNTMNDFLRRVGCNPATGGGKRGDAARIRAQHRRLFSARFTFAQTTGDEVFGSESRRPIEIASEIRTFWDYRNPDQGCLWESYVVLTKEFQEALVANPVPFDFEHLKALKRSALAIDLYCWLTYRIHRANNSEFLVPYHALHQQFGTGYKRERDFRAALAEELAVVQDVFPAIRYEFEPRGLAVAGLCRRELPVPSEIRPAAPSSPVHGSPAAERPYHTAALAVMGEDLKRIDRLARKRGLNLDDVMQRWRAWCIDNRVYPKNPAAHLTGFIKNHDAGRSH